MQAIREGLCFRKAKFCELFARLYKEEQAQGVDHPQVGRRAALMAGYGAKSYTEQNALLTADNMYNRLMKEAKVRQRLRELGLEKEGRYWTVLHD